MNNSANSLTKAWRACALGGFFFAVAGTAVAQDRSVHQREGVSGRLMDVSVIDADFQRPLPLYSQRGRHYVAGTPGQPYRLQLTNRSNERVMAVVSVDGINVLSGDTASPQQSGYVLGPYQTATIDGWRKSLEHVARFEFAPVYDSYAGRTNRPQQVGVIGVAVFRERAYHPLPRSAPAPMVRSDSTQEMASAQSQRSLGTGHGRSEWSPVDTTTFVRSGASPVETLRIDYDSWEALAERGIVPSHRHRRGEPDPFPAQRFVPDPPRHW